MRFTIVAVALVGGGGGCSLDTDALGEELRDGAPGVTDGGRLDAADGFVAVDAGTPCDTLGGPRVVAVLDADDFDRATAERDGVEVERPGQLALSVSPYRFGGLLVTGYDGSHLGDPPSFDGVLARTPSGRAMMATLDHGWSGPESLPGLLLGDIDRYTAVATGEIFLGGGSHGLRMEADDVGLVEVDGLGSPARAIAGLASPGTISFDVPASGWYPIRVGWADEGGNSLLRLELTLPDSSTERVGPSRLRADLSSVPGRELFGWDSRDPGPEPDGERIDVGSTVRELTVVDYPQGVGITDSTDFTARWVGRHLFGAGGTLSAEADDHYELWVDGVFYGQSSSGEYSQVVPPGMHDVIFELDQGGGGRHARLRYRGEPFPLEDMRPRTRFGGVPFGAGEDVATNVDGGNTETVTLTVDSPDGPVAAVEVSVIVSTSEPESVELSVEAPDGETFAFTLDTRTRRRFLTDQRLFRAVIAPEDAATSKGDWNLVLTNAGSTRARWLQAGVLVHARGASSPYETTGVFTSAPLDLGVETALERVQSLDDRPFGTDVRVDVRASATEGGLPSAEWVGTDGTGALAGELRGRYAQLRVTLDGPGHDTPRVSDLRLIGRPCMDCEDDAGFCPLGLEGLVARYTFEENGGQRIRDVSGVGEPLDLYVLDEAAVTWSADGLTVTDPTIVTSFVPASKIIETCMGSSELTVEAWVRPANTTQDGPARIVSLSENANSRLFTLGQDGGDYILRLRSSETNDQGDPEVGVTAVETGWQHLVGAKDSADNLRIWVDGVHQITEERPGDYSTWDPQPLNLGNELTGERPWLGDFRQVSIYCRALSPTEVGEHFAAGMSP